MKKERRNKAVCFTTGFTAELQKNRASVLIILSLLILTIGFGCSNKSTSPKEEPYATIMVMQNGVVQDTIIVKEENTSDIYPVYDSRSQIGEIIVYCYHYSVSPEEDPMIYFFVMGKKDDSFTLFKEVYPSDTLRFDYQLDFDLFNDSLNCGTMYQGDYINDARFSVWKDSVFVDSLFTDSLGRFQTSIESNNYVFKPLSTNPEVVPEIYILLKEGYADYFVEYYYIEVGKPNIYLYPENTIELDVSIDFPQTGEVTISDPHYPEKWQHITVEPDGTIDGQYRYLFYESKQPNFVQRSKGWIVPVEKLEGFFQDNMNESGFIQAEIDDFIEYWIPRLTESKYYALYPQYNEELDPLIQLNFSIQPDNILRLIYVIEEVESDEMKLEKPMIPHLEREGFVVAEWGVVID